MLLKTKKLASIILTLAILMSLFPAVLPKAAAVMDNWTDAGNYNTVAVGNITINSAADLPGLP